MILEQGELITIRGQVSICGCAFFCARYWNILAM